MVKMRYKEYTSILLMVIEKYYSVSCLLYIGLKLLCCHVYFAQNLSIKFFFINFYWHIIALQYFVSFYCLARVSQVAQWFKKVYLPMQVTWVLSPNWEDPLEKEMATHSSILVWEIPQTVEPGVTKELDTTQQLNNNNCTAK